jgi:hypothetical protein
MQDGLMKKEREFSLYKHTTEVGVNYRIYKRENIPSKYSDASLTTVAEIYNDEALTLKVFELCIRQS